jgi:hypothetical protein
MLRSIAYGPADRPVVASAERQAEVPAESQPGVDGPQIKTIQAWLSYDDGACRRTA